MKYESPGICIHLAAERFTFAGGSNTNKPSTDEYYTENEMCMRFALQFIVEVLYKNITKVPTEVKHMGRAPTTRMPFHFHFVALAIIYSKKPWRS